jgi:DHA1 family tetracycline resistance protein-like MFS transporter
MPVFEQGELQGIITSLMSLATIISPLLMTHLFYFFTRENKEIHFPGLPFIAAAIIAFAGFLLYLWELQKEKQIIKRKF